MERCPYKQGILASGILCLLMSLSPRNRSPDVKDEDENTPIWQGALTDDLIRPLPCVGDVPYLSYCQPFALTKEQ